MESFAAIVLGVCSFLFLLAVGYFVILKLVLFRNGTPRHLSVFVIAGVVTALMFVWLLKMLFLLFDAHGTQTHTLYAEPVSTTMCFPLSHGTITYTL